MTLLEDLASADLRGYEIEVEEIEQAAREHAATISVIRSALPFGKAIWGREREAFLQLAKRARLSEEALAHTQEAVGLYEDAIRLFTDRSDPAAFERIEHVVVSHGLDPYPFLRILEAVIPREVLPNMLRAENASAPHRRAGAILRRRQELTQRWQRAFHTVGLDGDALQKVFGMKPSRAFGKLLKDIQAYTKKEMEDLPDVPPEKKGEIIQRIEKARTILG